MVHETLDNRLKLDLKHVTTTLQRTNHSWRKTRDLLDSFEAIRLLIRSRSRYTRPDLTDHEVSKLASRLLTFSGSIFQENETHDATFSSTGAAVQETRPPYGATEEDLHTSFEAYLTFMKKAQLYWADQHRAEHLRSRLLRWSSILVVFYLPTIWALENIMPSWVITLATFSFYVWIYDFIAPYILHPSILMPGHYLVVLYAGYTIFTKLTPLLEAVLETQDNRRSRKILSVADVEVLMHRSRPLMMIGDQFIYGRKVFVSDKGHVGWAPDEARLGDVLCIFDGSSMPFCLRATTSGAWMLVGACYVLDYMEAGSWIADGIGEAETFNIK